jgi:hypothetical protein
LALLIYFAIVTLGKKNKERYSMPRLGEDQLQIQNELPPLEKPLLPEEEKQETVFILSRKKKRWIYFALTIFSFGAGAN